MPTVKELKELCKEKGIKGYSKLKKTELEKLCLNKNSSVKVSMKKISHKNYEKLSLTELKNICKSKGIKGYSQLTKPDLITYCTSKKN